MQAAAVEGIREVCITTNGILLPQLAKPLLIRPFYKKTLGEAFDICMDAKFVKPEDAQKVIDAVEAM